MKLHDLRLFYVRELNESVTLVIEKNSIFCANSWKKLFIKYVNSVGLFELRWRVLKICNFLDKRIKP